MKLTSDQFYVNEVWILCRIDQFMDVQDQPVDVYILIDAASDYIFGQLLVPDEMSQKYKKKLHKLFKKAKKTAKEWPKKLILPKGDPAKELCQMHSKNNHYTFEMVPLSYLSSILDPVQQSFSSFIQNPSSEKTDSEGFVYQNDTNDESWVKDTIPDSYDLCSCASGKKYKFCCKPIFRQIIEAMCAAEEGRIDDALDWMKKAQKKVGETPEIICRYAVIYSFYDEHKFYELLIKTLEIAPNHPRANYLFAIHQTKCGQLDMAIASYKKAIANYPVTDKYHLNEVWNNLANIYYAKKDYYEAKTSWEKAIMFLPKDKMARANFLDLIVNNPDVPEVLKTINPFIKQYFKV